MPLTAQDEPVPPPAVSSRATTSPAATGAMVISPYARRHAIDARREWRSGTPVLACCSVRGLLALTLSFAVGCGHTDQIRAADVPRLARLETDDSVLVWDLDGNPIEVVRYKEVRLYPKSGHRGYVLRRPIRVGRFDGEMWLKSGQYAPIPFEPRHYAGAELVHSNRTQTAWVAVGSGLAGVLALFLFVPVLAETSH